MKNNENQTPVVKKLGKRGPKNTISFAGVRWDRQTNREVAEQIWNDPEKKGLIRTKSFKNFCVTVFLKRKKLAKEGRKVQFAGRTVLMKGEKVKKTKWVRSPKVA
jgi:hypothetical protein